MNLLMASDAENAGAATSIAELMEPTLTPSELGQVRVLVVEDDAQQQEILVDLFAHANDKNMGAVTFEVTGKCRGGWRTDGARGGPSAWHAHSYHVP